LGEFKFPADLTFVVAVSGAEADKTGNAMADYNNAAFLAFDAAKAWVRMCARTHAREGRSESKRATQRNKPRKQMASFNKQPRRNG
jgi:hypothetical protein